MCFLYWFQYSGDPLAVIDADEEIFNKEHQLEIPVRLSQAF